MSLMKLSQTCLWMLIFLQALNVLDTTGTWSVNSMYRCYVRNLIFWYTMYMYILVSRKLSSQRFTESRNWLFKLWRWSTGDIIGSVFICWLGRGVCVCVCVCTYKIYTHYPHFTCLCWIHVSLEKNGKMYQILFQRKYEFCRYIACWFWKAEIFANLNPRTANNPDSTLFQCHVYRNHLHNQKWINADFKFISISLHMV